MLSPAGMGTSGFNTKVRTLLVAPCTVEDSLTERVVKACPRAALGSSRRRSGRTPRRAGKGHGGISKTVLLGNCKSMLGGGVECPIAAEPFGESTIYSTGE